MSDFRSSCHNFLSLQDLDVSRFIPDIEHLGGASVRGVAALSHGVAALSHEVALTNFSQPWPLLDPAVSGGRIRGGAAEGRPVGYGGADGDLGGGQVNWGMKLRGG